MLFDGCPNVLSWVWMWLNIIMLRQCCNVFGLTIWGQYWYVPLVKSQVTDLWSISGGKEWLHIYEWLSAATKNSKSSCSYSIYQLQQRLLANHIHLCHILPPLVNGFWLFRQALQTFFFYIYEVTSNDLLPSLPEIDHKSITYSEIKVQYLASISQ